MPRVAKKQDFKSLYETFKKRIEEDEILKNDALLAQQLKDFERMAEMNDNLWNTIQDIGYYYTDEKTGRVVINPAVGTFNKNASTLLKAAQWIEDKTKAITIADGKKTW